MFKNELITQVQSPDGLGTIRLAPSKIQANWRNWFVNISDDFLKLITLKNIKI